ncbi:PITH domain protein [Babesia caballi]|uniref:PITH domain protein n=1 Tax=Babesia caballi TaxID=5871 RepID=A0AAV4LZA3_BABCB|nr:PITH domain protein [Babesia caballi]
MRIGFYVCSAVRHPHNGRESVRLGWAADRQPHYTFSGHFYTSFAVMGSPDPGEVHDELLRHYELSQQLSRRAYSGGGPVNLALVVRCLDYSTSTALNAMDGYGQLSEVLLPTAVDSPPMVSDVDEQLILKLFFIEPVNIAYIVLQCDEPPDDVEASAPKTLHLYVNRPEFDFIEADTVIPHQKIVLDEATMHQKHPLKATKFDRVRSLHVFVVDNLEGVEHTYLNRLTLYGTVQKRYPDKFAI